MAKKKKKTKSIDRVLEGVNESPNRKLSLKVFLKTALNGLVSPRDFVGLNFGDELWALRKLWL